MKNIYVKNIIFLIIAFLIIIGIVYQSDRNSYQKSTVSPAIMDDAQKEALQNTTPYPTSEVAKHNNQNDCWTMINGSVYNVTSWITKHPGGAKAIIGLCGIDGSSAFNNQHGGQSRPQSELATFKIGIVQ